MRVAGHDRQDRRRAAFVRHVNPANAGCRAHGLAGQVQRRPHAARTEIELVRILLCPGDQSFKRGDAACRGHDHDMRHRDEHRHGDQVVRRVEWHGFVQTGRGCDSSIAYQERVAVGRRFRDGVHADHRRGTRFILDHDRHAQLFRHGLCHVARDHVGGSAGRPGHDPLDGFIGVRLRLRVDAGYCGAANYRAKRELFKASACHRRSPFLCGSCPDRSGRANPWYPEGIKG